MQPNTLHSSLFTLHFCSKGADHVDYSPSKGENRRADLRDIC